MRACTGQKIDILFVSLHVEVLYKCKPCISVFFTSAFSHHISDVMLISTFIYRVPCALWTSLTLNFFDPHHGLYGDKVQQTNAALPGVMCAWRDNSYPQPQRASCCGGHRSWHVWCWILVAFSTARSTPFDCVSPALLLSSR